MENPTEQPRPFDPRECDYATPYMVNNGVLDMYICQRFGGNCYFEPNGGPQFKKICEPKGELIFIDYK
jgi:hypothetical protein